MQQSETVNQALEPNHAGLGLTRTLASAAEWYSRSARLGEVVSFGVNYRDELVKAQKVHILLDFNQERGYQRDTFRTQTVCNNPPCGSGGFGRSVL